jgi:hypothetical protein
MLALTVCPPLGQGIFLFKKAKANKIKMRQLGKIFSRFLLALPDLPHPA